MRQLLYMMAFWNISRRSLWKSTVVRSSPASILFLIVDKSTGLQIEQSFLLRFLFLNSHKTNYWQLKKKKEIIHISELLHKFKLMLLILFLKIILHFKYTTMMYTVITRKHVLAINHFIYLVIFVNNTNFHTVIK